MNKTELVAAMAKEAELPKKDVEAALKAFIDVVSEELKNGGKIQLVGFGTFEVKKRKGSLVRDIHTREQKRIDDYQVVVFRPGDNLKDAVKTQNPNKLSLLAKTEKK